jgi:hypothetical protein
MSQDPRQSPQKHDESWNRRNAYNVHKCPGFHYTHCFYNLIWIPERLLWSLVHPYTDWFVAHAHPGSQPGQRDTIIPGVCADARKRSQNNLFYICLCSPHPLHTGNQTNATQ